MSQLDLDKYRREADKFIEELSREHYLHYSGRKEQFELEEIYGRYSDLFNEGKIESLRSMVEGSSSNGRRRLRYLLEFSVEGFLGQATKGEAAQIALREATLEIEVGGSTMPYRQSALEQANEPEQDRREAIEQARLALIESELNPLYRQALERVHDLARKLDWSSYRAMYEDLSGIDYVSLERKAHAFSEASEEHFEPIVGPEIKRHLGLGLDRLRRSDIPHFFRSPKHDRLFPPEKLTSSFLETMAGLGIDVESQKNVFLDLEDRPNKSPRAFCAPVLVPQEVYLVVPRIGGRDDYFALFHEGGHTEHYAHVDPALPFEYRRLGDNSVTEAFAFLFHHLVEDPVWLKLHLGVENHGELNGYSRAVKLIYLRRYAAKLRYELDLHVDGGPDEKMRKLYAELLGNAIHTEWPEGTYLSDVDPGYYAASYLRAWALESNLRRQLRERFGEGWFDEEEAGNFLRDLWSQGQKLDADELLEEVAGTKLDFSVMLEEVSTS